VTATHCYVQVESGDATTTCSTRCAPKEMADIQASTVAGMYGWEQGFRWSELIFLCPLGASRNVRITGDDDDDNALSAYVLGWRETR